MACQKEDPCGCHACRRERGEFKFDSVSGCLRGGCHRDDTDDNDYCTLCGYEEESVEYDSMRECIEDGKHLSKEDSGRYCTLCGCRGMYVFAGWRECTNDGDHLKRVDSEEDCILCGTSVRKHDTLRECLISGDHDVDDGECVFCGHDERRIDPEDCNDSGYHLSNTDSDGDCLLCGASPEEEEEEEEVTEYDSMQECLEARVHQDNVDDDGDCVHCGHSDDWLFETVQACIDSGSHLNITDGEEDCIYCGSGMVPKDRGLSMRRCLQAGEHLDELDDDDDCRRCGASARYLFTLSDCIADGHHLDDTNDDGCILCGAAETEKGPEGSSDSSDEDEDEDSGDSKEPDGITEDTNLAVEASLRRAYVDIVLCGYGTDEYRDVDRIEDEAWDKLSSYERESVENLMAGDLDGWLESPPTEDKLNRLYHRIVSVKSHHMEVTISKTLEMMERRERGEAPMFDYTLYETRIREIQNPEATLYYSKTPQNFVGCAVRVSLDTPGSKYDYEHIWVDVTDVRETDDDDENLKGIILQSPEWADAKAGESITLANGEITDVYKEGGGRGAYLSIPGDYAVVLAIWIYSKNHYSPARAKEIWLKMSDKERLHVTNLASFLRRKEQRKHG